MILSEAFQLYQKNLGPLLLTCAILLVPASLAKAGAVGLILAPTAVVETAAVRSTELTRRTADLLNQQLRETDPTKRLALAREREQAARDLANAWQATGQAALGGLATILLGFVASLVGVAVLVGIAIPLTTAALTVIVADRATGGNAGPADGYTAVLQRFGALLSAGVPAFFLVLLGLCMLLLPGLILAFLFMFVTPVVLLENVGGTTALKRSVALVRANVPQVAVVSLVFAAIEIASSFVANLIVSRGAFFVASLLQDALLMFLLPIPIIGTVLLYLDIRRQTDGVDAAAVRASLGALRGGST